MTKKDALAPVVALEATVVGGRTLQAYKRGKGDEARERFLEEITGSIVWLWGVKVLNNLGDNILKKVLKSANNFDVGTDKVLRTPFQNFMKKVAPKGFSEGQVALMKGAKVLSSILIANLFIGFVVPKVNHYITNTIRHNKHEHDEEILHSNDKLELSENNVESANPSFKGGMAALNAFTNAIENTNTGKLLSTDLGIAGGRALNARSGEERREILFRDLGSIYFYMWAQGHVIDLMNFAETGKFSRLNPGSAGTLTEYLNEFITKNGGEMNVEDFKKAMLGKNAYEIKLPNDVKFESGSLSSFQKLMSKFRKTKAEPLQVAKVKDLEQLERFAKDSKLMDRIREMAKLQPEKMGEAVITKQQLIDAINVAEINDPKFLKRAIEEFTEGACTDEFRYVSDSRIRKFKREMDEFVEQLCKSAKDGKINKKAIDKFHSKNVIFSALNFASGFAVAALFLSTIIPKIQYYITRKSTGVDAFPGTYDFKKHEERPY